MKKYYIFFVFIFYVTSYDVSAAIYKGQMIFATHCVECHTGRVSFIESHTKKEWNSLFKNRAKKIIAIHKSINDEEHTEALSYIQSARFLKKYRNLREFLVEYAKDSGKVPACN